MLSGATNTNGLIRSGLDPTRGEHANHYTIDEITLDIGEDVYPRTFVSGELALV
jgi:hypothetical protein